MQRELMALEPGRDDPRSVEEIADQMEAIHAKYEGRVSAFGERREADKLDHLDIDTKIEWLNEGKSWYGPTQQPESEEERASTNGAVHDPKAPVDSDPW
jgi:hypothetical protein